MNFINKVFMFQVAVLDMDKSKEFYTDKLGFKLIKDTERHGHRWVLLSPSDGIPSIILTTSNVTVKPGTMKMYLSTPNIEETYNEMVLKGINLTSDILADTGGTHFSFEDPDGNVWVVVLSGYGDVPPDIFY